MTIHDDGCPACHAPTKQLKPHGAIVQDHRWLFCAVCAKCVLVRVNDGLIVRIGKA